MTPENKLIFVNRLKSFGWRSAMMGLAGLVGVLLQSLDLFQLDPFVIMLLGLVLGELSKYLNKKL